MSNNFLGTVEQRRSYYSIGKQELLPHDRIEHIVQQSLLHTPSAFNSQSARVLLLFGNQHTALWNIVRDTLRLIVPPGAFAKTEEKLASFDAGYGTMLFYEDMAVVEQLMAQFPLYKDQFPLWSMQASGMVQFVVWTALEAEGLGASLQHYNPLIDDAVRKRWELPTTWKLMSQMPFGAPMEKPDPKKFLPLEGRLIVAR